MINFKKHFVTDGTNKAREGKARIFSDSKYWGAALELCNKGVK